MKNITEPTLLLNEEICKTNINRMADKARDRGLAFKPHMKTHQSAEIGEWIREAGAEAITVSSVKMAQYFANHGWDDITIAFPCNILLADKINELAASISLTLLVNSVDTVQALKKSLTHQVKAYIEIDTGSNRTGLQVDDLPTIQELIGECSSTKYIEWVGFYSHPGHSYGARSKAAIQQIHNDVVDQFQRLRSNIKPTYGDFEVCVGDTPCCTVGTDFEGINAISPGNFVFYDLMQHKIGCCEINDIAVAMACPVVDTFPKRTELAIHGGAIHFSKEILQENGLTHFGKVASDQEDQWGIKGENSHLKALSQEHGIVKCSEALFSSYQVGDIITILPIHSCLTANLMHSYQLTDGQQVHQL